MSKTITCDSCGKAIIVGNASGECSIFESKGVLHLHNQPNSILTFKFKSEVTTLEFTTTGLDFCRDCIWEAMTNALKPKE